MPVSLYGKYPAKRDFVAFNLPTVFLSRLEAWLQSGIAISRERLGSAWHDYYVIHPIWNFRVGADILGADTVGSIMPSVDAVGRFFPLVLLAHAQSGKCYPPAFAIPIGWFSNVHQRLLSALSEQDVPEPVELLRDLDEPLSEPIAKAAIREIRGVFCMTIDPANITADLERFCEEERLVATKNQAMFWTSGGQFVVPQVLVTVGMPSPEIYTRMMSGQALPE